MALSLRTDKLRLTLATCLLLLTCNSSDYFTQLCCSARHFPYLRHGDYHQFSNGGGRLYEYYHGGPIYDNQPHYAQLPQGAAGSWLHFGHDASHERSNWNSHGGGNNGGNPDMDVRHWSWDRYGYAHHANRSKNCSAPSQTANNTSSSPSHVVQSSPAQVPKSSPPAESIPASQGTPPTASAAPASPPPESAVAPAMQTTNGGGASA